jgi:hypothetical protein
LKSKVVSLDRNKPNLTFNYRQISSNVQLEMSFDISKAPMVRITWHDARDTETGWIPIKDIISAPLAICQEVGYMVVNNQQKIVVMRSWCTDKDDNHGGGAIAIPKGWVTKIEYLQVAYSETT